jgi:hypothetical protein
VPLRRVAQSARLLRDEFHLCLMAKVLNEIDCAEARDPIIAPGDTDLPMRSASMVCAGSAVRLLACELRI